MQTMEEEEEEKEEEEWGGGGCARRDRWSGRGRHGDDAAGRQGSAGSVMAWAGSQVKETVMAKRVPQVTCSTRCRFSEPDEKKETRPEGRRGGGGRRGRREKTLLLSTRIHQQGETVKSQNRLYKIQIYVFLYLRETESHR